MLLPEVGGGSLCAVVGDLGALVDALLHGTHELEVLL